MSKIYVIHGQIRDAFDNLILGLQRTMPPDEQVEFLKEAVPLTMQAEGELLVMQHGMIFFFLS